MADKTYLIKKADGSEFQITIPDNYSLTFGLAAVGVGRETRSGKFVPMCLRVYEGNSKTGIQRAVFTDVADFRDMSIPILEKRHDTQEKHGTIEVDGVKKSTTFKATTVDWVNPDEIKVDANRLIAPVIPDDTEMFGAGSDE